MLYLTSTLMAPFKELRIGSVLAAVLPAIFLLRYIYRLDRAEKEPAGLLISLLLLGVLSALCATVLEGILGKVLDAVVPEGSLLHTILLAFVVVAMSEEGCKLFFLKRRTWNHPQFNYRFDAIVYAVFVSLGFAAYENILYVFQFGLGTAVMRAFTAVPAHMCFAVVSGVFYGRAKGYSVYGYEGKSKWNYDMAYVMAVVFHGFYDACAMTGTELSAVVFILFTVLMFLMSFRLVRRESWKDQALKNK